MRIGFDASRYFDQRGPGRVTRSWLQGLLALADDSELIAFTPDHTLADDDCLRSSSRCQVVVIPRSRIPWTSVLLPWAARRLDLDVMLFPANHFWLRGPCPSVVALLDIIPTLYPERFFRNAKERYGDLARSKSVRFVSSRVVTISQFCAHMIFQRLSVPADRISIVPLGIADCYLEDCAVSPWVEDQPYLLFVGGFDFRKNIDRLLAAYATLRERGRSERLVMIGPTGNNPRLYVDVPALLRQYGLEGSVRLLAPSTDDAFLMSLYAGAELLVFPSLMEGFGLPPLEAMGCGCPVVASKAASIPEVVGDAAVLFDPYSVEDMVESVVRVLDDPDLRQELRHRGRSRATRFRWSASAAQLLAVVQEVTQGRGEGV